MFRQGAHHDLSKSLETIGASFAIFELQAGLSNFKLISANTLFEEITETTINDCIGKTLRFCPATWSGHSGRPSLIA
jgi:hypothetical protein